MTTDNPSVDRYLLDKVMDNIDHALGRPADPLRETYRNYFAVDDASPKAAAFRASPHWIFTGGLHGGMVTFSVTTAGRQALRDHLREVGDNHRAYLVTFDGHTGAIAAESPAKAKYEYWLRVSDVCPDLKFGAFCRAATARPGMTSDRHDAPRPALILWLLAMVMLALPGWIWLGVTLFARWAGP